MYNKINCYCRNGSSSSESSTNCVTSSSSSEDLNTCYCNNETDKKSNAKENTVPVQEKYYTEQLRKQDAFWTTTIEELSKRIKTLQNERCIAECSVQAMESSLLPYITSLMIELSNKRPNVDVNGLLKSIKLDKQTNSSNSCTCLPDIAALEYFAIQDNDLLYMDIIKMQAEEVNKLQSSINRLKSQSNELLMMNKRINDIFAMSARQDRVVLNRKLITELLERLQNAKKSILAEIEKEKNLGEELKNKATEACKELLDEEKRKMTLTEALNIAGANLEIACSVNGRCAPSEDKVISLKSELSELKSKHFKLQEEMDALYQEAENMRINYKKKMWGEIALPELNDNGEEGSLNCQIEDKCTCNGNGQT